MAEEERKHKDTVKIEKEKVILDENQELGISFEEYKKRKIITRTYTDDNTSEVVSDEIIGKGRYGVRGLNAHNNQGTYMSPSVAEKAINNWNALPEEIKTALSQQPITRYDRRQVSMIIDDLFHKPEDESLPRTLDLGTLESKVAEEKKSRKKTRKKYAGVDPMKDIRGYLNSSELTMKAASEASLKGMQVAIQDNEGANALFYALTASKVGGVLDSYRRNISKKVAEIGPQSLDSTVTTPAP